MQKIYDWSQKTIEVSFLLLLFLTPFVWTTLSSELFEFNKMILIYLFAVTILGAWALKSVAFGKFIFKRTILDIPLLFFLGSQIISTAASIDLHLSIFGYYSRVNGSLLSTFAYLIFYWAYVSNLDSKATFKNIFALVLAGFLISLYGISEHFGGSLSCVFLTHKFNDDCWVQDVQSRVFATLGQPNWLAAWLVAIIPLTWIGLATRYKRQENKALVLLSVLSLISYFLSLLFTDSRSGLLGFLIAFAVFWGALFLKDRAHFPTRLFLSFTLSLTLAAFIFSNNIFPSLTRIILVNQTIQPPTSSLQSQSAGGTESGDIRKIVWKGAVEIWKHYPIFGSGVETFGETYYNFRPQEHNQTSEWNLLYNKAHNEYLNYLANTGAVGLGTYLLIIFAFGLWIIRVITNYKLQITNDNLAFSIWHLAFFAGFASILVTNFFGFSISVTNTLFFIFPAMAITVNSTQEIVHRIKKTSVLKIIFLTFVLCTMLYLLSAVGRLWLSDYHYNQASKYLKKSWYTEAALQANEAVNLNGGEPLYYDKLAQTSSYLALQENEASHSARVQDLVKLTIESSNLALSISPRNLTLLKSQAIIFNRLGEIDNKYVRAAIPSLEEAVKLAPTDPETAYSLGVLYNNVGENAKALEIMQKAVDLKPDYYDARLGLGQIYAKLGLKPQAKEQFQFILDHINPNDQDVKDEISSLNKKISK